MTYEEYLRQAQDIYKTQKEKQLADNDLLYKQQADSVGQTYQKAIEDSKLEYEDLYRENAVQKLVNERKIARNMAESGLTDSGLNRTQKTAAQLSYGYQNRAIDLQRQKAIDTLSGQLAEQLAAIETKRLSDAASIGQSYDKLAADSAQEAFKAEQDAITERQKAYYSAISKAASGSGSSGNSSGASGKGVYIYAGTGNGTDSTLTGDTTKSTETDETIEGKKVFYKDGKKYEFAIGVNPYTGTNNSNTKAVKDYGTFSNGYQPKGVIQNGIDYGKLNKVDEISAEYTGKQQNIWSTTKDKQTHYWLWRGDLNRYLEVEPWYENGEKQWILAEDE